MSKLLRAGFRRYMRSFLFWISSVIAIGVGIYSGYLICNNFYMEDITFMILPIVETILISLMIGREYSDGIFRNKIVAGYRKGTIFLSETILALGNCLWFFLLKTVAFSITNSDLMKKMQTSELLLILLGFLLITITFTAITVFISCTVSNRAFSVVINIVLVLCIIFSSDYIDGKLQMPKYMDVGVVVEEKTEEPIWINEPNPGYIDGFSRNILETVQNSLPYGQIRRYENMLSPGFVPNLNQLKFSKVQSTMMYTLPLYSLGTTLAFLGIGYVLFKKRNFK